MTKIPEGKIAGAMLFVACAQFNVGMVVAEAFYSGYSVSQNYISDLGATCRTTCQIIQPASTIFNASVILLGLMIIAGAYFIHRAFHIRLLPILIALAGVGAVGVGVFPETAGFIHHIVSLIAFVFSGLSAIASVKMTKPPLAYLSPILGAMTLGALAMYVSGVFLGLGPGGMERMIVYPALLWGLGFGAYLTSAPKQS